MIGFINTYKTPCDYISFHTVPVKIYETCKQVTVEALACIIRSSSWIYWSWSELNPDRKLLHTADAAVSQNSRSENSERVRNAESPRTAYLLFFFHTWLYRLAYTHRPKPADVFISSSQYHLKYFSLKSEIFPSESSFPLLFSLFYSPSFVNPLFCFSPLFSLSFILSFWHWLSPFLLYSVSLFLHFNSCRSVVLPVFIPRSISLILLSSLFFLLIRPHLHSSTFPLSLIPLLFSPLSLTLFSFFLPF